MRVAALLHILRQVYIACVWYCFSSEGENRRWWCLPVYAAGLFAASFLMHAPPTWLRPYTKISCWTSPLSPRLLYRYAAHGIFCHSSEIILGEIAKRIGTGFQTNLALKSAVRNERRSEAGSLRIVSVRGERSSIPSSRGAPQEMEREVLPWMLSGLTKVVHVCRVEYSYLPSSSMGLNS